MNFKILILGTDINAYYMARCYYEIYKTKASLIGCKPLSFTKYSNIVDIKYVKNFWNEKVFLKTLKSYGLKHKEKILLISTNETYTRFISKNKDKLSKNFIFNVPELKTLDSLIEKEQFYKTYKTSNLSFPNTIYYNFLVDKKIPKIKKYPIILKPSNVIKYNHLNFKGKNKIYKIENQKELIKIINLIKNHGYNDTLIIQEYIPGGDDMLFDAVLYSNQNGKVEFISFAQIGLQERTENLIGNAAVLINGLNTTKKNTKKEAIKIKEFIESINYTGFAEVDMKYDIRDNKFKILEINARQGRSSYYIRALGKNLIKVLIDDCIFKKEHPFEILNKKVLLSFVPLGIIKKYIKNEEFKKVIYELWNSRINPVNYKEDKNIKRFLMLRKRWFNYFKEYKNSYWKE